MQNMEPKKAPEVPEDSAEKRPVADPGARAREAETPFGYLKGTVTIHGDIIAPIDKVWEADR